MSGSFDFNGEIARIVGLRHKLREAIDKVASYSGKWEKENAKLVSLYGEGTPELRMRKNDNLTMKDAYSSLQHWKGMAEMYAAAITAENQAADAISELRRAEARARAKEQEKS